eukprot:scaffold20100_cov97-Isochrysis_galbana.AAC.2
MAHRVHSRVCGAGRYAERLSRGCVGGVCVDWHGSSGAHPPWSRPRQSAGPSRQTEPPRPRTAAPCPPPCRAAAPKSPTPYPSASEPECAPPRQGG